eukprot:525913-Heterocapsa_arctica.AAC.1
MVGKRKRVGKREMRCRRGAEEIPRPWHWAYYTDHRPIELTVRGVETGLEATTIKGRVEHD